jgi:hypothetical protein
LLLAQALRECYEAGKTFAFIVVVLDCVSDAAKAFYQSLRLSGIARASVSAVPEREAAGSNDGGVRSDGREGERVVARSPDRATTETPWTSSGQSICD